MNFIWAIIELFNINNNINAQLIQFNSVLFFFPFQNWRNTKCWQKHVQLSLTLWFLTTVTALCCYSRHSFTVTPCRHTVWRAGNGSVPWPLFSRLAPATNYAPNIAVKIATARLLFLSHAWRLHHPRWVGTLEGLSNDITPGLPVPK